MVSIYNTYCINSFSQYHFFKKGIDASGFYLQTSQLIACDENDEKRKKEQAEMSIKVSRDNSDLRHHGKQRVREGGGRGRQGILIS